MRVAPSGVSFLATDLTKPGNFCQLKLETALKMDTFDEAKQKRDELRRQAMADLTPEEREIFQGTLSVESRAGSATDEERQAKLKEFIERIAR